MHCLNGLQSESSAHFPNGRGVPVLLRELAEEAEEFAFTARLRHGNHRGRTFPRTWFRPLGAPVGAPDAKKPPGGAVPGGSSGYAPLMRLAAARQRTESHPRPCR